MSSHIVATSLFVVLFWAVFTERDRLYAWTLALMMGLAALGKSDGDYGLALGVTVAVLLAYFTGRDDGRTR